MRIDIHSHIIPKIDDGSRSIEETFNLVKEAYNAGFRKIFCTSHYMEDNYEASIADREAIIKILQKKLDEDKIDIKLYNGCEVFITPDIDELLRQGKVGTLNNTRYLLMELPLNTEVNYWEEMLYKLASMSIVPIIAHPERYNCVQKDIKLCDRMIELGAILQSNYASTIGYYGHHAKKTVMKLLKEDKISFLGSDVHRANSIYPQIDEICANLEKKIGKQKLIELTETNPEKVIENIEISRE